MVLPAPQKGGAMAPVDPEREACVCVRRLLIVGMQVAGNINYAGVSMATSPLSRLAVIDPHRPPKRWVGHGSLPGVGPDYGVRSRFRARFHCDHVAVITQATRPSHSRDILPHSAARLGLHGTESSLLQAFVLARRPGVRGGYGHEGGARPSGGQPALGWGTLGGESVVACAVRLVANMVGYPASAERYGVAADHVV